MTDSTVPFRLTFLAAALASTLAAQASDDKPAPIQKVEVKGSAEQYDARRDDTATRIVVNHDEIIKYGDSSVLDVLKRLPGITVTSTAGRNGGEIRMRGLGSGYTQILIDGERAPAGFSMESLAPESIERIEILRAASAEFSTQSVAGTVNIVLRKAVKKGQRELKLSAGGSRLSKNASVSVQTSDRVDKLSWSLTGALSDNRNDSNSREEDVGRDVAGYHERYTAAHGKGHFKSANVVPRLIWTLGEGESVTLQSVLNTLVWASRRANATRTVAGMAPPYAALDSDLVNKFESMRNDLTLVKKLDGGARLDLKIGANFGNVHNDWDRLGADDAGQLALDTGTYYHETDQAWSSTGKYFTPLVDGHALAFGWDAGLGLRAEDRRIRFDPVRVGEQARRIGEHFETKVSRMAVFAQDEWNITPRWSIYLGGRWEGVHTRTSGTGFDESTSTSSVISPLMHTLYKLPDSKGDQLRLALTRTYKAPSTYVLMPRRFVSDNNKSTDPDSIGNPNLKPELATGLDASFEHYWGESALVAASFSVRRITGYTSTTVTQHADGRWVSMAANDGNATSRSLDLEAKFPLKSVFDNAPALDLRASVSRNWSKVDSIPGPANRLDQQNPMQVNLGADYKGGQLSLGGSFVFRKGGPVRLSKELTRYQNIGRELEMYGLWKFDQKNQLRLSVNNMLVQPWIDESVYTDSYGPVWRKNAYTSAVALRATLEMKF
jgi:outer membrane receptor for ferrienterochelin and colicins